MILQEIFGLDPQRAKAAVDTLSPRELEVAALLAMGKATSEIIPELGISVKTLDLHWANIKRRLDTTTFGLGRVWFAAKFVGLGTINENR